jgi:hypothetical protein
VMYSYKDLAELAGYTARVSLLLDTMSDARRGKFEKNLVASTLDGENSKITNGRGKIFEAEDIQFENVPIVTPNGDVLLKSLTFNVKPGVTISLYIINLVTTQDIGTLAQRWAKWVWEVIVVPYPRWTLACLWWYRTEATCIRFHLNSSATLSLVGYTSRSGHLPTLTGADESSRKLG